MDTESCMASCKLCLMEYRRVVDIRNTDLHPLYEKLSNTKIDVEPCWMCYICHTRLQQCHELWLLADRSQLRLTELDPLEIDSKNKPLKPLVELSQTKVMTMSMSEADEVPVKQEDRYYFYDRDVLQIKRAQETDSYREDSEELSSSSYESSLEDSPDTETVRIKQELIERGRNVTQGIQNQNEIANSVQCMVAKNSLPNSLIKVEVERHATVTFDYEGNEAAPTTGPGDGPGATDAPSLSHARHKLAARGRQYKADSRLQSIQSRPHACDVCPRRFKLKSGLSAHRRLHSGERPFACDHCPRAFTSRTNLRVHLNTHTGEKPYSCDICQRRFSNGSQLRRHIPRHADFRPFECALCDRRFLLKDVYQKHVRRHAAAQAHRCDVCQAEYKTRQSLKVHYRSHTGEKPYCCDACGLRFSVKRNLERHATSHSTLKPFACRACPAAFKTKQCLRAHERRHTGDERFTCHVCQRRFAQNCDLRNHLRTHVGDRPYACELCPSRFYQRSSLSAHVRTHTGERPYACDVCARRFTQNSSLTRHRRTHAGKPYA